MQDSISYSIPTFTPPNPTQRAIDSLIRLHSPQNSEIAFALAILDIGMIKLDCYAYSTSYNLQKVREVLEQYLQGQQITTQLDQEIQQP